MKEGGRRGGEALKGRMAYKGARGEMEGRDRRPFPAVSVKY